MSISPLHSNSIRKVPWSEHVDLWKASRISPERPFKFSLSFQVKRIDPKTFLLWDLLFELVKWFQPNDFCKHGFFCVLRFQAFFLLSCFVPIPTNYWHLKSLHFSQKHYNCVYTAILSMKYCQQTFMTLLLLLVTFGTRISYSLNEFLVNCLSKRWIFSRGASYKLLLACSYQRR